MESLKRMAELIATGVEVVAALIIVYGVLDGTVLAIIDRRSKTCLRKTHLGLFRGLAVAWPRM
jgi:hypothetical protein